MQAVDLIEKAKKGQVKPCPPKLKAELAKILAYNDTAAHKSRVSADAAQILLAAFGLPASRAAFNALIRREFGRGWGK